MLGFSMVGSFRVDVSTTARQTNQPHFHRITPDGPQKNDDNNAAFGRCMAWECWHENYYKTVMLINPRFQISANQANVDFKIVSGLFMDDNTFQLIKENRAWMIAEFSRPIN